MGDEGKKDRVDLDESAQPMAADASHGEFSAYPKEAVPEFLKKNMQPKTPNQTGKDEASVQPVSALPDTEREPPPANKK